MKKIVTLFRRSHDGDRLVMDEVTPGAEWVIAGEGYATQKFNGTCCMVRDGVLHKRHISRRGTWPPEGFEVAETPDPNADEWPGWLPVGDGPDDQWHRVAFAAMPNLPDGTYELCGPKINGNTEDFPTHVMVPHGCVVLPYFPRDFLGIKRYLLFSKTIIGRTIEGIVWHHPDGRMVKIKRKDFTREKP